MRFRVSNLNNVVYLYTLYIKKVKCDQERPYHNDSTASRLLSEVKHCRARLVLRWGTTLESLVLFFCLFHLSLFFCFYDLAAVPVIVRMDSSTLLLPYQYYPPPLALTLTFTHPSVIIYHLPTIHLPPLPPRSYHQPSNPTPLQDGTLYKP